MLVSLSKIDFYRQRQLVKRAVKYLLLLLIVDITLSSLWTVYILNKTDGWEKHTHYQVVVILFADFNKDYSGLGPETFRRLNFGLSLMDEIQIENFLCVGGSRPTHNIYGAKLMKDYLQRSGVPPERVYADGRSFDTKGNWDDALKAIEQNNWKTAGVISSAFHLYRAKQFIITPMQNVEVSLIPFEYKNSMPKTTLYDMWVSVHYEWVTFILYALPESVYNSVLTLFRPQETTSV